jgi:hypothetical protein
MRPKTFNALFVVQGSPPPEREADYHRWYDEVHGPDGLACGSFREMRRYRAVGPGERAAPFLALWNADYPDERAAWEYIQPRAEKLRAAGRVDDIVSVRFALMMFSVPANGPAAPSVALSTLTTVQNDWRHAEEAPEADAWWVANGLERAPRAETARLYTSDAAGKGAGYHLALFEQSISTGAAIDAWRGIGTAGSSPVPAYRTIFDTDSPVAAAPATVRPRGDAWVMHWELISALP